MKETDSIDKLVTQSIQQYTAMVELMSSIAQFETCKGFTELTKMGDKLHLQQKTAVETDKLIMAFIIKYPDTLQNKNLSERQMLLKEAIRLNAIITPKITSIKSLLFNELQQVKNGRFAMKGYLQTGQTHGRNINNTL